MTAPKNQPAGAPEREHPAPVVEPGSNGSPEDASQFAEAAPSPPETPAPTTGGEQEGSDVSDSPAPAADAPVDISPEEDAAADAYLADLEARAEKADAYLALAQRTQADFENYRKRTMRDASVAKERGVTWLAKELLPAIDSLDRALSAAEDGHLAAEDPLVAGVKLVHNEVLAALSRVGIEPFSPKGEPFDPNQHEAMAQQPVDGAEPGTVVEVYQRGYRLGETVLRPARVVVAGQVAGDGGEA
jgi:molecular chaperone GrpE